MDKLNTQLERAKKPKKTSSKRSVTLAALPTSSASNSGAPSPTGTNPALELPVSSGSSSAINSPSTNSIADLDEAPSGKSSRSGSEADVGDALPVQPPRSSVVVDSIVSPRGGTASPTPDKMLRSRSGDSISATMVQPRSAAGAAAAPVAPVRVATPTAVQPQRPPLNTGFGSEPNLSVPSLGSRNRGVTVGVDAPTSRNSGSGVTIPTAKAVDRTTSSSTIHKLFSARSKSVDSRKGPFGAALIGTECPPLVAQICEYLTQTPAAAPFLSTELERKDVQSLRALVLDGRLPDLGGFAGLR